MSATSPIVFRHHWTAELYALHLPFEAFDSFAHHPSFAEAWKRSMRPDHLLRIAGALVTEPGSDLHRRVARAAGACARMVLDSAPPDDERPRLALRALDRWCDGNESREALAIARRFTICSAMDCPSYAASAVREALAVAASNEKTTPAALTADAASNAASSALDARPFERHLFSLELAAIVRTMVPLPSLGARRS